MEYDFALLVACKLLQIILSYGWFIFNQSRMMKGRNIDVCVTRFL